MLLALLLTACGIPDRPDDGTGDATLAYFFEYCRLYESDPCESSRAASCGLRVDNIEYQGRQDCVTWQKWHWSQCPGLKEVLDDNDDLVRDCNDQLADFDCRSQDWCDTSGKATFLVDACGELRAMVDEKCAP